VKFFGWAFIVNYSKPGIASWSSSNRGFSNRFLGGVTQGAQLPHLPPSYRPSTPVTAQLPQLPPIYRPATAQLPQLPPSYRPVTPATAQLPPSYRPSTPATAQLPPSYRPSTPATAQLPTLGCFSGSSTSSTFPWISVILSSNPLSLIICLPKLHILRITACTQAGGPTRQAAGGRRPRGAWQAGRSDGQGLPPAPRALLLCPTWPCG